MALYCTIQRTLARNVERPSQFKMMQQYRHGARICQRLELNLLLERCHLIMCIAGDVVAQFTKLLQRARNVELNNGSQDLASLGVKIE